MTCCLAMCSAILCMSVIWAFKTWPNLELAELVYHMKAPLEGTNESMIFEYIGMCIVPGLVVLLLVILILKKGYKNKKGPVLTGVIFGVALLTGIVAVAFTWKKLDVSNYIEAQGSESKIIDSQYVDPGKVSIEFPKEKRNLIYIFLESMEVTYTDPENGGGFPFNCIPELTKLAEKNEDFSGQDNFLNGAYTLPGTTWTMGAMFAHSSGLPLNIPIDGNAMETQESFFPEITTLGDILAKEGYQQELLIGSDAAFGGRKLYYQQHGNFAISDYLYAKEKKLIPEDYYVWWGYEDKKLFSFAKKELEKLSSQDQPFHLTMLTADTHFENGYICKKCIEQFPDNYANVMACSSRQIKKFINWIKKQDFYENTTIILAGDHLTMDSDFCMNVDKDYPRKVYVSVINAPVKPKLEDARVYSTLDLFPTTVAALGADIEGDRLGLGTNLFSDKQTLLERFGIDYVWEEIGKKSKVLDMKVENAE